MVEETKKWSFVDYLMMAVVGASLVLDIIFKSTGYFGIISFISFSSLFIVIALAAPIRDYKKKDILKSRMAALSIAFRTVLVVMLIISSYKILLSNNYNLRYTYWTALISFILIIVIFFSELIVSDYKRREAENKRYNGLYITGYSVILLLLFGFQGCNSIISYVHPKHQIALDNLKTPKKILIYRYDKNEKDKMDLSFNPISEISSPEDIKKITSDLEAARIKNLSSADLINYQRMRDNSSPYYIMQFHYDTTNGALTKLENGYIEDIIVTTGGSVAIEELSKRDGMPSIWRFYTAIYPVSLSEGTTDIIFGFLK